MIAGLDSWPRGFRLRFPLSDGRSREMEKVVLHRCPVGFLRGEWHGCHAVQKALEEQGIEHEVRKVPIRKGSRAEVLAASGQATVPVIEFADGSGYREDGKEMASEIRAGRLFEHKGDVPPA
jgi:glutaredoxin